LTAFCKHQYSRGKTVAANHVSPTQRVIVTSRIVRLLLACVHGKLPYATPTFISFYFVSDVRMAEMAEIE